MQIEKESNADILSSMKEDHDYFKSESIGAHWGFIPFDYTPPKRQPRHEPEVLEAMKRAKNAFIRGLPVVGTLLDKKV